MPIREEIIGRAGDAVITRNGYGACCLNVPNVLFGDVDVYAGPDTKLQLAIFFALLIIAASIVFCTGKNGTDQNRKFFQSQSRMAFAH